MNSHMYELNLVRATKNHSRANFAWAFAYISTRHFFTENKQVNFQNKNIRQRNNL